MSSWEIASSFLEPGYTLIAPDGTTVGTFDSLEDAQAEMRRLLAEQRADQLGRGGDAA